MIPLMLDLAGKKVVIFGGGDVGVRKARFFSHDAEVTVVSRSFSHLFDDVPVTRITRDLTGIDDRHLDQLLEGSFIAIAATPDQALNDRIGERCREHSILFNNASGGTGDLLIPSVIGGDYFILAISTCGASPALSRFLREYLESAFPNLDHMVALQERLRLYLQKTVPGAGARKEILWKVLHDPEVWNTLGKGEELAWEMVTERYL
jgi:precorrin-2 dehydrogenase/sirohydrochlorin ferrochelatase